MKGMRENDLKAVKKSMHEVKKKKKKLKKIATQQYFYDKYL